MGFFTKLGLRNGVGSVGETTRAILLPYMGMSINDMKTINQDFILMSLLITRRIQAADLMQVNVKSFLGVLTTEEVLNHLDRFNDSTNKLVKSDITFMVLIIIYLESIRKREAFQAASESLLSDTLEVIYEESQKLCPNGIKFTKEDFTGKAKIVCSYLFRLYELLDQQY